ncbi:MAG: hypothetical protein H6832_05735 [Planctomycetes bacterium]|nr:hypothetical protein [Planctomycetota bacterium]MCB9891618.1 hypothetical protein [Planctomycetota bacterium]MCB9917885.1 hypothetical protein [Planctomycetota bacterium]
MHIRSMILVAAVAAVSSSAALSSQSGYHAYIGGNTPGSGACSVVPMGSSATSGGSQLRSQMIQFVVTKAELGNQARRLTNLAFAPCDSGVRYYGRLTITFAYKKPGAWSTTFADNVLASTAYPKVKVFDQSRYDWPNRAGQWNNVGLTYAFDYDPQGGDLLVEIVARNADFSGTDPAMRSDSRACVVASAFSATPKTGALAMTSTKVRLSDGVAFVDSFMQPCGPGPLQLAATGSPTLTGAVDFQIANGTKTTTPSIGVLLLGFQPANINGLGHDCAIYVTPDMIFWAPLTNGVSPALRFQIPNIAALVGGKVYFQGAHQDAFNTKIGFVLSGRSVMTIGW